MRKADLVACARLHAGGASVEELFATGMCTPDGDIRTKITDELTKLGPVNEANVYNWFQNKKARTKKKAMEELAAANRSGGF